ncbi:MAG: J domain-containing protein [Erythrobacter sp.]
MLLRIAILLLLGCVLFRWAFGEWPWANLLGTGRRRGSALDKARALLGVANNASREEIIAAHRRLAALVHPDRGGSHDALREANAARDLLLAECASVIEPDQK